MLQEKSITRRRFLKKTASIAAGAVAFPYIVPESVLAKAGSIVPSERITVGCIGLGPQGNGVLGNFLSEKDAQVVALCDVNARVLAGTVDQIDRYYSRRQNYQVTACTQYADFRKLLARSDIDVVLIATPDHWHVPVALAAAKAGKDIYLEKPMGLSITEDQTLRQAVHRHKTVFQFGTQQRSDEKFRLACELVRNGRIGKLRQINVWCFPSFAQDVARPEPIPEGFDYDMWLGPAPFKPYTKNLCVNSNPRKKTWWFDSNYALGWIAGWGVHALDIALWGAGKEASGPVQVQGIGQFPKQGACDTATDWDVTFNYASGLRMNFRTDPAPAEWKNRYGNVTNHGTAFEGADGWVHVNRETITASPQSLLQSRSGPNDVHIHKSKGHVRDLLDCIKTRNQTICNIDEAVRSDIVCHLADIATRLGHKLKWDPQKEEFIDHAQANRMLTRAMASPWYL